jgi:predicted SprT family Zn-dependent metalloprotease
MKDNPRALLTPRLMKRVEDKLLECIEIAKQKFPKHEWPMPEVRYDAYGQQWLIRLNLILCFENEDHFVNHTVPHEFAHLMQRRVHGFTKEVKESSGEIKIKKIMAHGKEWKEMMGHLDQVPRKYHNYDTTSIAKRHRSSRGAVITGTQTALMLKRLENGVKRLQPAAKKDFLLWLEQHIEELPENEQ